LDFTEIGYYRVAARLLYNALRFRVQRIVKEPLKPVALSIAVTNRCNSHCVMCNIWRSANENPDIKNLELPSQKIISILYSRLFSELVELDLTGGEPHLRDDLVDIVLGIIRLKKNSLPGLRSIIITSNGFLTRRILANYQDILNAIKDTGIDLVSVTSLDGIGDIHNRIRGIGDAFKLASGTIKGLVELKKEYRCFIPGIKTTILPWNIDVLDDILSYASSNNLFHIISPVIFTKTRFKNIDRRDEISLTPSNLHKVSQFYRRDELRQSYFYSRGLNYFTTGKKQWVCAASYNYLFIDYDGKVYSCEMVPEKIGDVKTQDIMDIWKSHQALNWRKKNGKMEYCKTCHEPGAIRYSATTEGAEYMKFLAHLGKRDYKVSLVEEGYSKYF
jgi:MoaA/NifB/PqqE/SkfB family radical SAM enzyme